MKCRIGYEKTHMNDILFPSFSPFEEKMKEKNKERTKIRIDVLPDDGCGIPTSPFQDERGVCEKTTTRTQAGSRLDTCSLGSRAPPTPPALLRYSE